MKSFPLTRNEIILTSIFIALVLWEWIFPSPFISDMVGISALVNACYYVYRAYVYFRK